jgi:hypothetical protein
VTQWLRAWASRDARAALTSAATRPSSPGNVSDSRIGTTARCCWRPVLASAARSSRAPSATPTKVAPSKSGKKCLGDCRGSPCRWRESRFATTSPARRPAR